jgi:hypothetical protein
MNCAEYLKGILDNIIYGVGLFFCLVFMSAFIIGFWKAITK